MPESPDTLSLDLKFSIAGHPLQMQVTVPAGRTPLRVMLPIFQALTNTVVGLAEKQADAQGKPISCQKGCGACCRQLVPISLVEAHHLADLIARLPRHRRETITARFADARQKLAATALLDALENPDQSPSRDLQEFGMAYFALQIPCPFLEHESCSIHPDRPLACREYLVTSPAVNCAAPTPDTIARLELPGHMSKALRHLASRPQERSARSTNWLPLILAPHWAQQHSESPPEKTGPDLLREFFTLLA